MVKTYDFRVKRGVLGMKARIVNPGPSIAALALSVRTLSVRTLSVRTLSVRTLSGLFMPALCVHCRRDRWFGTPVCLTCLRRMGPIRMPFCGTCGLPGCGEEHSETRRLQANGAPTGIGSSRFLFRMGPEVSTLIHGFKYRHLKRHIRFMCAYLRFRPDLAAWSGSYDLLAPVPIHAVRKRERGYNQAEVIAREASRYLRLPLVTDALGRTRATVSQTKLNREERARNLETAFVCRNPSSVRGKRVLLVDDVYTTGATAERCAELLLKAGAVSVGVLALAKVETLSDRDDFALEMEAVSSYAG